MARAQNLHFRTFLCGSQDFKASNSLVFAGRPFLILGHWKLELWFSRLLLSQAPNLLTATYCFLIFLGHRLSLCSMMFTWFCVAWRMSREAKFEYIKLPLCASSIEHYCTPPAHPKTPPWKASTVTSCMIMYVSAGQRQVAWHPLRVQDMFAGAKYVQVQWRLMMYISST